MATKTKARPRAKTSRALRQSISIPASVATEVRRIAKERHLTISRALVTLAERGIQAERDAKENLRSTYKAFINEREPARKEEAAKDLIRAIFGKEAIAEDPFL
jgi:predicted DNA-binding ribbon-helix-helix protein